MAAQQRAGDFLPETESLNMTENRQELLDNLWDMVGALKKDKGDRVLSESATLNTCSRRTAHKWDKQSQWACLVIALQCLQEFTIWSSPRQNRQKLFPAEKEIHFHNAAVYEMEPLGL